MDHEHQIELAKDLIAQFQADPERWYLVMFADTEVGGPDERFRFDGLTVEFEPASAPETVLERCCAKFAVGRRIDGKPVAQPQDYFALGAIDSSLGVLDCGNRTRPEFVGYVILGDNGAAIDVSLDELKAGAA